MISSFPISINGLRAASVRAAVASENIANLQSTGQIDQVTQAYSGYKPKQVQQTSGLGGPQTIVTTKSPGFVPFFDPDHPDANADGLVGRSDIDLAQNIVDLKIAQNAYEANARVLRTASEMSGALIKILS